MFEWDEGLKHFMTHWFSGLMRGLEEVDDGARETVLRACGKACAHSYTVQRFQEARRDSADLDGFLAQLADKFSGARYEKIAPHTIRVSYEQCTCDLVTHGLVTSPLLCECSVHSLRENFERSLETSVTVVIESSLLRGGNRCALLVSLEEE